MIDVKRPTIDGIHHLKFPVSDLATSLRWWERIFGAERDPQFDHITSDGELFGYILDVPGLPRPLELRHNPGAAAHLAGFDVLTLATSTKADLVDWASWFENAGIPHSGVLRGLVGWLIVVRDPDGVPIRIYCRETHEWDAVNADHSSPWLA